MASSVDCCSCRNRPSNSNHSSSPVPYFTSLEALELPFINSTTAVTPQAASNTAGVPPKLTNAEADILQDFSDVLNAEGRLPPSTHGVEHHLITEGRPVTAKFQRLTIPS